MCIVYKKSEITNKINTINLIKRKRRTINNMKVWLLINEHHSVYKVRMKGLP